MKDTFSRFHNCNGAFSKGKVELYKGQIGFKAKLSLIVRQLGAFSFFLLSTSNGQHLVFQSRMVLGFMTIIRVYILMQNDLGYKCYGTNFANISSNVRLGPGLGR